MSPGDDRRGPLWWRSNGRAETLVAAYLEAKTYPPRFGSVRVPNSIVCPQFEHITGTTAEPSTGAPSAVSGSGVEMITCSGPTPNCPSEQTGHPCKPLDTRKSSIRSLLCCSASDAMLLPSTVDRHVTSSSCPRVRTRRASAARSAGSPDGLGACSPNSLEEAYFSAVPHGTPKR